MFNFYKVFLLRSLLILVREGTSAATLPPMTDTKVFKAQVLPLGGGDKALYNFERTPEVVADQITVRRKFTEPEGQVVATETLTYSNGQFQTLEVQQNQLEESGTLKVEGGELKFSYTKEGKTKESKEKLDGVLVPSDMINSFLRHNWQALLKGDDLKIRFPVLDRRETVGFKFYHDKDESKKRNALVIKMKPTSFVIAALVKPLLFVYSSQGEPNLQEVIGRTTPKIKDGNKWKDLDAILKF